VKVCVLANNFARHERNIVFDNTWKPLKNVNSCSSSRKTKKLTAGIYEIFRGLNFEHDADLSAEALAQAGIGPKEAFFKGLPCYVINKKYLIGYERGHRSHFQNRPDIYRLNPERILKKYKTMPL